MLVFDSTKQNQNQPWQAHKTGDIRKIVFRGSTSPINTDLLDHRYLETVNADFDVYCHK